eukprot:SAG31_NODE_21969_length_536_cov_2.205950_1_plen_123_part_00
MVNHLKVWVCEEIHEEIQAEAAGDELAQEYLWVSRALQAGTTRQAAALNARQMKMMQSPRYQEVLSMLAQKVALRYSLKQEAVQLQDELAKLRAQKKEGTAGSCAYMAVRTADWGHFVHTST